jgi:hypothetical protein
MIDLNVLWNALECYREDCIPEGEPAYDQEWNEICNQMSWIADALNIPLDKTYTEMERIKQSVQKVWDSYKHEIVESGDWFFNLDEHTLNFHDKDGLITVDIYQATNNQTHWDKLEPFKMYFKYERAVA